MNFLDHQVGHYSFFLGSLRPGDGEHGGLLGLHNEIDLGDMDVFTVSAETSGDTFVSFHDDDIRRIGYCLDIGIGGAEIEEAVGVHGGCLDHGDIRFR